MIISSKAQEILKAIPSLVTVVAVSKLQPIEKIKALYDLGHRDFGENYVQEFIQKKDLLPKDIRWHFIGSLQSKKLKFLVGAVQLIHSVDSLDHAVKINGLAESLGLQQKILVQINLSNETTKSGIFESDLEAFLMALKPLASILVGGFMTMPPLDQEPEKVRPYFSWLSALLNNYKKTHPALSILSMGTSHDYQVALEQGSNCIRIGTLLFGEREK